MRREAILIPQVRVFYRRFGVSRNTLEGNVVGECSISRFERRVVTEYLPRLSERYMNSLSKDDWKAWDPSRPPKVATTRGDE